MKLKKPSGKAHLMKELEQEKLFLEEINQYLSENENISNEVFDSMSHELRTPAVSIKAYTDMLLQGQFGSIWRFNFKTKRKDKANKREYRFAN